MVLTPADFHLHPSLRKAIKKFRRATHCEIRVDFNFEAVIRGCADTPRRGQDGTWIVPDMIEAYIEFHRAGFAHSIETWIHNQLVGGLYFIAIGSAVFGESMFHRVADSSKIALVALVCLCKKLNISQIDCQQNSRHLTSLGAREVRRDVFVRNADTLINQVVPEWQFYDLDWDKISALNLN